MKAIRGIGVILGEKEGETVYIPFRRLRKNPTPEAIFVRVEDRHEIIFVKEMRKAKGYLTEKYSACEIDEETSQKIMTAVEELLKNYMEQRK